MACSNPCNEKPKCNNNDYIYLIVLYILLVIILGAFIAY